VIKYFRNRTKSTLQKLVILLMCLTLLTPTMEKVVVGLGYLSDLDFSVAELVENEEESKESEKEEKKENELVQAEFLQWLEVSFEGLESKWSVTERTANSLARETPSPPPDQCLMI